MKNIKFEVNIKFPRVWLTIKKFPWNSFKCFLSSVIIVITYNGALQLAFTPEERMFPPQATRCSWKPLLLLLFCESSWKSFFPWQNLFSPVENQTQTKETKFGLLIPAHLSTLHLNEWKWNEKRVNSNNQRVDKKLLPSHRKQKHAREPVLPTEVKFFARKSYTRFLWYSLRGKVSVCHSLFPRSDTWVFLQVISEIQFFFGCHRKCRFCRHPLSSLLLLIGNDFAFSYRSCFPLSYMRMNYTWVLECYE